MTLPTAWFRALEPTMLGLLFSAGQYTQDVDGLGTTYVEIWAERLGAEIMPEWMTTFGIVDNAQVYETLEAETYAAPVREALIGIGRKMVLNNYIGV